MARLTKEQWLDVRNKWESDQREGFDWLVAELSLDVSRQAVSKTAKANGWGKVGATNKVAQPKKESCAASSKVAQPSREVAKKKDHEKRLPEIKKQAHDSDEKSPVGRPTLYQDGYAEIAYKMCLLGATNERIADLFNVHVDTVYQWVIDHHEFSEALRNGKDIANAEIAHSLYHRAKGYVTTETKAALFEGEFVTIDLEKHYPPDVGAAKVFLYNRDADNWKDRQESTVVHKLDKEMLEAIKADFVIRLERARERQRTVLIERGIIDIQPS